MNRHLLCAGAVVIAATSAVVAQRGAGLSPDQAASRLAVEKELASIAVIERKVMMPMRDGVRLATDIYRPKDTSKKVPTILVRTPYNFNYWDVRNGAARDMTTALTAVKRGYAYVDQNERGHFFSEGNYDILGPPRSDGDDALTWLAKQPWSNGKVGTTGCSSTAEYQMGVAATGNPAFAAMNVQGFGAGVGRVGGYYEQGNWYRGGAVQMLFIAWIYGQQNQVRPMFPLPVATGGRMIQRAPDDPAWYKGGLWHDNMPLNVPGLYFMSWYDVSVGPNLALFNHVRKTATPEIANQQWAVIAPTTHCGYTRATADTIVGERSMGDARLDYTGIVNGFFDRFVKGEKGDVLDRLPKVTYFTMGLNKWQTSDTWPPRGAAPVTFYLSSGGNANTLNGDGALASAPPAADTPDAFTYDPANPVLSYGGNVCCTGNAVTGGAFDQRKMETRPEVLVYTSQPFAAGTELSGPIEPTLYVSSDATDTDFTVKVIDLYPDGRAYNLDESIQRMRYRDGYDKPLVWMERGKVYKVTLQPLTTSTYFAPGHRLRIEVTSSNFPRFDRNLNTGGRNYDEVAGVVAHNVVHHSVQYPSQMTISVVKR